MTKKYALTVTIEDDALAGLHLLTDRVMRAKFLPTLESLFAGTDEFGDPKPIVEFEMLDSADAEETKLDRLKRFLGEDCPTTREAFEKTNDPQCAADYDEWNLIETIRTLVVD